MIHVLYHPLNTLRDDCFTVIYPCCSDQPCKEWEGQKWWSILQCYPILSNMKHHLKDDSCPVSSFKYSESLPSLLFVPFSMHELCCWKPLPFYLTSHCKSTRHHPVVSTVFCFGDRYCNNNMRLEHQVVTKLEPVYQEVKRCYNNMLKLQYMS